MKSLASSPGRRYDRVSEIKLDIENVSGLVEELPAHLRRHMGYDYQSRKTRLGLPLIHLATGVDLKTGKPRRAKGVIAIGDRATGIVAIGVFPFGALAIGAFPFGAIAVGLVALGGGGIGLAAAFGAFALAPVALGAFSVGYFASGVRSFGVHAAAGNAQDQAAVDLFPKLRGSSPINFVVWVMSISFAVALGFVLTMLGIDRYARKKLDQG